jgi:hypothetical protein
MASEGAMNHSCDYCHKPADGTEQWCSFHPLFLWLHPACQYRMLELYRDPKTAVCDIDGKIIAQRDADA